MRCPYCGGINSDQASYCVHCGRDMRDAPSRPPYQTTARQQPPYQQTRQPPPSSRPTPHQPPQPPYQQPRSVPPQQQGRPVPAAQPRSAQNVPGAIQPALTPAPAVAEPEPPAPFPPRTMAELEALAPGALDYTLISSGVSDGHKKVVQITYRKCASWQQVATLLKAFKEQQEQQFDTIIIQGILGPDSNVYGFTNGQLRFDRNVRLGSQVTNRYQIETGNGYESDSIRVVLTE